MRAMGVLPGLLGLCAALGCQEFRDHMDDDQVTDLHGEIDVSPNPLDLGDPGPGSEAVAQVVITNVGDHDLAVTQLVLDAPDAFELLTDVAPFSLAPEEAAAVDVEFSPLAAGAMSGTLQVHSDDPDNPRVDVLLQGACAAPMIEIDPAFHHFGETEVCCPHELDVVVRNVGTAPLLLDDASVLVTSTDELEVTLDFQPGVTLPPGAEETFEVQYMPMDEQEDTALVTVLSNDPWTPEAEGEYAGNGVYGSWRNDHFVQEDPPQDTFSLQDPPAAETITVKVDKVQATVGWTYDGALNAVIFNPNYVPSPGQTVDITYAEVDCC